MTTALTHSHQIRPQPSAAKAQIAIIGAGPTGLGAAFRLSELGVRDIQVYEQNAYPGGLAASFLDDAGFTWDIGGHVQFSHYRYFDDLMDKLLASEWQFHLRESWIWIRDRFVPYPFQNNLHRLPQADVRDCLRGLLSLHSARQAKRPKTFEEWILTSFGEGVARLFLLPYNYKVWAYPPREMSFQWVGERVATVDLERVIFNILDHRDDAGWGPNNQFRFPSRGGTGEIWRRLAAQLPEGTIRFAKRVERIDPALKKLHFSDGSSEPYDILISTMPLGCLLRRTGMPDWQDAVATLRFSNVHVVGIGLRGSPPPALKTKCWMYFPENQCPFYRATVFSNYSPNNVPDPRRYWSLMLEVSESPAKPVDRPGLIDSVIDGLVACRLIESKSEICNVWTHLADYGYPTPFLGRDVTLKPLLKILEDRDIYSRGRFGGWKYEVSNQDHSLMQGVELINRIFFGTPEITYEHPDIVNGKPE